MIKIYIILLILFLLCLSSNNILYGGNLDDRNRKITTIKNLNNIVMNQKQFRIYNIRNDISYYMFSYYKLSYINSLSNYKNLLIQLKNSVTYVSNSTLHDIYRFITKPNSFTLYIKIFNFDNIDNDIFKEEHKEYIIENYSKLLNDLNKLYKIYQPIIINEVNSEKHKILDDKSILEIIDDEIQYCNNYPNLDKDKIFTESKIINIIKWVSGRDDIKIDKINNEYKVLINNSNKELKMSDFKFPKFKLNYTHGALICPKIFIDKQKFTTISKYNKIISNLSSIIFYISQKNIFTQIQNNDKIDFNKINISNLKNSFKTLLNNIKLKNNIQNFEYYLISHSITIKEFNFSNNICKSHKFYNFTIKYYDLIITMLEKKFKTKLESIINVLIYKIDNLKNDKLEFIKFITENKNITTKNTNPVKIYIATGKAPFVETGYQMTLESFSEYISWDNNPYNEQNHKLGMFLYNHNDSNNKGNLISKQHNGIASGKTTANGLVIHGRSSTGGLQLNNSSVGFRTYNGISLYYINSTNDKRVDYFHDMYTYNNPLSYYDFNGNLKIKNKEYNKKIFYNFKYKQSAVNENLKYGQNPIFKKKNKYIAVYQYFYRPVIVNWQGTDNTAICTEDFLHTPYISSNNNINDYIADPNNKLKYEGKKCWGPGPLNGEPSYGDFTEGGVDWKEDPFESTDETYRNKKMRLYWIKTDSDKMYYNFEFSFKHDIVPRYSYPLPDVWPHESDSNQGGISNYSLNLNRSFYNTRQKRRLLTIKEYEYTVEELSVSKILTKKLSQISNK